MDNVTKVCELIATQQALQPKAVERWAKATKLSFMELVQIGADLKNHKIDSGDFVVAVVWDEPIKGYDYTRLKKVK